MKIGLYQPVLALAAEELCQKNVVRIAGICGATVQAVQEAYEDMKAGRTRPAAEVLEDLRLKHGLPR